VTDAPEETKDDREWSDVTRNSTCKGVTCGPLSQVLCGNSGPN
jgi:hypothetical protein